MLKRCFYKVEHGNRDDVSDSSSSSSDSDADSVQKEEEEEEVEETIAAEKPISPSSGSGYESEDSSGNDLDCDSSGQLFNEDDEGTRKDAQTFKDGFLTAKGHVEFAAEKVSNGVPKALNSRDSTGAEFGDFVLKCKSVFKCRICPRIVCLSEDTSRAHLNSKAVTKGEETKGEGSGLQPGLHKGEYVCCLDELGERHARSKKLLDEGRLKLRLNSDGEIEEEQETHAERHARIVALAQDSTSEKKKKKNKGRQQQRQRLKKRLQNASKEGKASESMKKPAKKRRKT